MIGNLEGTLSSGGTSKCGGGENCFAFQAPTRYARVLRDAGFDAANLANNHAFDFGAAGQAQTVRALRQAGVAITGRPGEITVRRVGGIRVALLGFAPYAWASRLDDIPSAAALVRRAAGRAEVVVVTMHAGAEGPAATRVPEGVEHYLGENRGDVRAFARAVIAAGADLVLGSGPHVVRGVERFRGRLIVYSTGNFAGHRSLSVRGVLAAGAVVHVTVRGDGTVARGRWISTLLVGQGRPVLDPAGTSLALARRLSRQDFPRTAARIDANGTIRP
jgi:poly-gamma-glutamate capsule biosynthesis protein CapA/YwtB (metallophosphatase superfamily)